MRGGKSCFREVDSGSLEAGKTAPPGKKLGNTGQELPGGLFSGLMGKAQHFRFGFMVEVIACPRVQLGPGVQGSRYMKNGWECQRPSLHQTPRRHHSALSARVPGWQCSALSPGRAEGVWGRVLGPWNHRGCRLWEVTQRNPGAQRQLPSPVSCPSPVAPPSDSPWSSSPRGWLGLGGRCRWVLAGGLPGGGGTEQMPSGKFFTDVGKDQLVEELPKDVGCLQSPS